MSKQLLDLGNGALTVTESGGNVIVAVSESESLGGGTAAGVLSAEGSGSVTLSGLQAVKLAEALLNKALPAAAAAVAEPIEAFVNSEIAAQ